MARASSRVPTGRFERLLRFGALAGGFAAGGVREGARRLLGGGTPEVNPFLTAKSAEQIARRLSHLRGASMKLGQLLSMQGDDFVPPEFAHALDLLRDSADVMPESQLRGVLGREYGKGWERRFARFDMDPIASASIGQVHSARAVDGRDLALKVQYPGVARSIDSDLASLGALLQMTRILPVEVDVRGILAEARAQLHREADYEDEADNLERYRSLVAAVEPSCVVPRVFRDLSTRRILAMERVRGTRLDQMMRTGADRAANDALGALLLRLFLREVFEFRFVQTDPNFGNYLVEDGTGRLALLDLGGARAYEPGLTEAARRLLGAGRRGDQAALLRTLREMEFLADGEPAERATAVVEMVLLVAEPMRQGGTYDFGATDLAARVNKAKADLVLRKGYLRAPPARTIFLLRKLAGIYCLLNRLGSRLDVARVVAPFLGTR